MYIIDKNKDYYDYLSHIYGIDKGIVFDRRGSNNITDEDIYHLLAVYRGNRYILNDDYFILLEAGKVQYLIQVYNFKYKKELNEPFYSYSMKLLHTYNDNIHHFDVPISIRSVTLHYHWRRWKERKFIIEDNFKEDIKINFPNRKIDLPILAKTKITSLIPPEEIWSELQNYISSIDNDKDVSISMTDVDKAEVHGFDKKTSFRHPVKTEDIK